MYQITERLSALLTIKSLVTLLLTLVFAALALMGRVTQDFLTVYTVVIAFYFGTQSAKKTSSCQQPFISITTIIVVRLTAICVPLRRIEIIEPRMESTSRIIFD